MCVGGGICVFAHTHTVGRAMVCLLCCIKGAAVVLLGMKRTGLRGEEEAENGEGGGAAAFSVCGRGGTP